MHLSRPLSRPRVTPRASPPPRRDCSPSPVRRARAPRGRSGRGRNAVPSIYSVRRTVKPRMRMPGGIEEVSGIPVDGCRHNRSGHQNKAHDPFAQRVSSHTSSLGSCLPGSVLGRRWHHISHRPGRRLGGQAERREEPAHGVGLGHRAQDPPWTATVWIVEDLDREPARLGDRATTGATCRSSMP